MGLGVTAELECLLDDVLTGRQQMMGAIDAVCDSARRIIDRLAVQGDEGVALVAGQAPGGDRPPTAAMKQFAATLAKRKGIKPPRGYTKSAAVCRAFLDEHAPTPSGGQTPARAVGDPKPGTAGIARSDQAKGAQPSRPRQRQPSGGAKSASASGSPRAAAGAGTALRIPYDNKQLAFGLGARHSPHGWYAPSGVDLTAIRERGWL